MSYEVPAWGTQCAICDEDLPADREDGICKDCRTYRILSRRDTRPKITPMPFLVEFAPVRKKAAHAPQRSAA